MSIIFWNVRGATSREFLRNARELIHCHKPEAYIIVEPRISGVTADNRIRDLGFDCVTKEDAQGFSEGIWVLWNRSVGDVTLIEKNSQIITVKIKKPHAEPWAFSAVYASPQPAI
ncbi:hypothetical protein SLA2020_081230 [Shorea laevis]